MSGDGSEFAADDDGPAPSDDGDPSHSPDGGAPGRPDDSAAQSPAGGLRTELRAVARIARWEVSHTVGVADRRRVALGVAALAAAVLLAGGAVTVGGTALDADIYSVGVDADSPYREPVERSAPLSAVSPDGRSVGPDGPDVIVDDPDPSDAEATFRVADSRRGQAALSALRSAVADYTQAEMGAESEETAAFPVVVTVRYVERGAVVADAIEEGSDGSGDGVGDGGTDGSRETAPSDGGGAFSIPGIGLSDPFAGGASGSPAEIRPPFPFGSLVLAFAFLVPLNFIVQAYGGTILDERVDRRGELLLAAPIARGTIVAGKTLPYLAVSLIAVGGIALAAGGGALSVAAVAPVAAVYLGASFLAAMLARSFKELTFVTVTISVLLTTYVFVPAIFTSVTPLALISPLTLVVRDLEGAGVGPAAYAFSTGPFYVVAAVLFALGTGVYREEDMFTQRPVPLKFLDALAAGVSGYRSVALWSALFVPFAFMAELLAIAVLFVFPPSLTLPLVLAVVAVVEEAVKSVHVFAGFARRRLRPRLAVALGAGAASGVGFFVGEKAIVISQLVGLPELTLGRAVVADAGAATGVGGPLAAALVLAPLVLHAVTASLSAVGATRGRNGYLLGFGAAAAVHVAYNLAVLGVIGGV